VGDRSRATIDYWRFGGWAVDFYVGFVTRPHDDLDVGELRGVRSRLIAALVQEKSSPRRPSRGGEGSRRLQTVAPLAIRRRLRFRRLGEVLLSRAP